MAKKSKGPSMPRLSENIGAVNRRAWSDAQQGLTADDLRLLERMARERYRPAVDDSSALARIHRWAADNGRSNFMLGLCSGACGSDLFTTLMPIPGGEEAPFGYCPVCQKVEAYIPLDDCPSPAFVRAYEEMRARGVPDLTARRLAEEAGPSLIGRRRRGVRA